MFLHKTTKGVRVEITRPVLAVQKAYMYVLISFPTFSPLFVIKHASSISASHCIIHLS